MDINASPKIVSVSPKNYSVDISTDLDLIKVGFSTDLDPVHILGNVRLQNKDGVPIPIGLKYQYRTIEVSIKTPLEANTSYQLFIYGDSHLGDSAVSGVRSILGIPLEGNAVLNFTTVKVTSPNVPIGVHPASGTVATSMPAFNWKLEDAGSTDLGNNTAANIRYYEVQVSKSNTMSPIYWTVKVDNAPVYPEMAFDDGLYYWRVRSIDIDGRESGWSDLYTFNLDTVVEAPITPEDTLPPEIGYDPLNPLMEEEVEVLGSFPAETFSNVAANLKTITFTVLGTVAVEDISIEMFGESVMGESEDHGMVNGTIELIQNPDGTTTIAYTPDVLQN